MHYCGIHRDRGEIRIHDYPVHSVCMYVSFEDVDMHTEVYLWLSNTDSLR